MAGGSERAAADNCLVGQVRDLPPIIPSGDKVVDVVGNRAAGKRKDQGILELRILSDKDMLSPSSCRFLPFHLCRERVVLPVGGRHRVVIVYIGIGVVVVIVGDDVQKLQIGCDNGIIEAENVVFFV